MPDLFADDPIQVGEIVAELERELRMRRQVYPRLVARGQLDAAAAARRIKLLEEAGRLLSAGRKPSND